MILPLKKTSRIDRHLHIVNVELEILVELWNIHLHFGAVIRNKAKVGNVDG